MKTKDKTVNKELDDEDRRIIYGLAKRISQAINADPNLESHHIFPACLMVMYFELIDNQCLDCRKVIAKNLKKDLLRMTTAALRREASNSGREHVH